MRQAFTDFETIVITIDNASSFDSLSCVREQPARRTIPRQDSNLGFAAASNGRARAGHMACPGQPRRRNLAPIVCRL
jgi:GT2 family glycosyltransferase